MLHFYVTALVPPSHGITHMQAGHYLDVLVVKAYGNEYVASAPWAPTPFLHKGKSLSPLPGMYDICLSACLPAFSRIFMITFSEIVQPLWLRKQCLYATGSIGGDKHAPQLLALLCAERMQIWCGRRSPSRRFWTRCTRLA